MQDLLATDLHEAPALLLSETVWMQEKLDGERRQLVLRPGEDPLFLNRYGQHRFTPPHLALSVVDALHFDGEYVDEVYYAFDLLHYRDVDLTDLPYSDRFEALVEQVGKIPTRHVVVIPTARTPNEKRNLWKLLLNKDAEGAVFKDPTASYQRGRRQPSQRKIKFWNTITVEVAAHNERRSVEMKLRDGEAVGTCPIPVNRELPRVGSLIEVRYIYASPGSNALNQPTLLRVREDIPRADGIDTLRYKP